ncbi:flavin-containing amine oxidase [Penicillium lividum]|nr:flavin-containing amine oxidase [Penicillium lividum]
MDSKEFEMGGVWVHWNQPHLYHELQRYDLHRHLKTSAGTCGAEKQNCLEDITFNPPLSPLRREAIASGHINMGAKIHFRLAATEPGWFATSHESAKSSFLFAFSDHNENQPSGPQGTWAIGFGYNGHLTGKMSSSHIIKEFQENIRCDVEGHGVAGDQIVSVVMCKNCRNPMEEFYFVSADWADGWRGLVDGAIESGQKAANDVKAFNARASSTVRL